MVELSVPIPLPSFIFSSSQNAVRHTAHTMFYLTKIAAHVCAMNVNHIDAKQHR